MLKKALDLVFMLYGSSDISCISDAVLTALKMNDDVDKTVALLMNVLSKSGLETYDLARQNFPPEVIGAIIALTRREDESYGEYLERIGKNECARRVKITEFKSKIEELSKGYRSKKTESLIEKYGFAIDYLVNCENDQPTEDEWV